MKYKYTKPVLFSFASALMLTACSSFDSLLPESKKVDYKSEGKKQLPRLELPPDLTAPGRDERYTVPDVNPTGKATFSAYNGERTGKEVAASSDILPKIEKMRIERSGSQRWLVVSGSTPDKLWPQIKDFWQENGFIVNVEQPASGIMETDWAENRAKIGSDFIRNSLGKVFDSLYSTPERDKFRTRLEPGAEAGSTEIYISHRGMYEIYTNEGHSDTRWQPREVDPELEADMLRRLMVRLGVEEVKAKSMIGTAQAKEDRAKLDRGADGAGTLTVQERFDRAWRRVGLALDRVGFTVEDRDRAQGFYYVRYVDPEATDKKKDSGFLSKLAFWKSSDINKDVQYRIYVKASGEEVTSVQVMTREGGVDKSDTSRKILGLLYDQLK